MRPRAAGILGMALGLLLSVGAGYLIGHPPFSVLGALVLVGATLVFAIAATWTVRTTWADLPDASISFEKALARYRWIAMAQLAYSPLGVGVAVWLLTQGEGSAWVYLLLSVMLFATGVSTLRNIRRLAAAGTDATPPQSSEDAASLAGPVDERGRRCDSGAMSMAEPLLPHHDRGRQDDLAAAEPGPGAPGVPKAEEPDVLPDVSDEGADAGGADEHGGPEGAGKQEPPFRTPTPGDSLSPADLERRSDD